LKKLTRKPLRLLAYLIAILAWLAVMSLPLLAFLIATRGEIQLGAGAQSHLRLFLVQENNAQGLGLEWSRREAATGNCAKTTVRYFLWEGSGADQGVEYCHCFDARSGLPQGSRPCTES
jgi:hypothetical protein